MPDTIYGLPTHVLLIHVIVVLAPLGALFTALSAVWAAARRKLGFISPLTCLIVLVFVPITTSAGNWLRNRIDPSHQNPKITRHEQLGNTFLYFAIGLFIVSAAVWWIGRRHEFGIGTKSSSTALPAWSSALVMVVGVAVAAVTVWQLYRIGDSGAHAVWDGIVTR
jgi:hypothetical protein